jgi:hypothetical protein
MNVPACYKDAKPQTGFEEYPKVGGYVLRCSNIEETFSREKEDGSGKNPMIVFDFDISRGEFTGFYSRKFSKDQSEKRKWPLKYYQTVTPEQIGRYKGVVESFKKSNLNFPDASFSSEVHDLKKLIGLEIGGVFCEEEYEKRDGSIGVSLKISYLCSVERIEKGDFTIPKKKVLKSNGQNRNSNTPPPIYDNDLPFGN